MFSEGRILKLDNFRRLEGGGFKGFTRMKGRIDKGHLDEFKVFTGRIASGGERLIPVEQLVNVSLASFAAVVSARERRTIILSDEYNGVLE